MSRFRGNMTNDMVNVYDGFKELIEEECLFCLEKLKEANKAGYISLPHTCENGEPLLHGARLEVYAISDYWYSRLSKATEFVSKAFIEEHELDNRYVGIE